MRLDRRIRLHVPVEIAGAGERRQQDAHRRAACENARITPATPTPAPRSAEPDTTAWIVSPAPCVPKASIFEIVLLEDAGVLAERRRLVLPVVDLPDGDLERVLRRRVRDAEREQRRARSRFCRGFIASSLCFSLPSPSPRFVFAGVAAPGFGLRAAASAARTDRIDLGAPFPSASRRTQYS